MRTTANFVAHPERAFRHYHAVETHPAPRAGDRGYDAVGGHLPDLLALKLGDVHGVLAVYGDALGVGHPRRRGRPSVPRGGRDAGVPRAGGDTDVSDSAMLGQYCFEDDTLLRMNARARGSAWLEFGHCREKRRRRRHDVE